MPFYYYYDPTYILILIGMVLSLIAQGYVKSTYARFSQVRSRSGFTGAQVAERILQRSGIYDVRIEHVSGNLTDHYDSRAKVVRLSDAVYGSSSVAAQAVAAHECGHVIQDATGYGALRFRNRLVPVAQFGANISWPLILIGFFLNGNFLVTLGIILFSLAVLFQLVTLPVEFNASGRALRILEQDGILGNDEIGGSRKVLRAAALTYVAAAAASILQLLRLLLIANRRSDD